MKFKLVDDANRVWTYGTAWVQYLAMLLGGLWASLPEDMRAGFLNSLGLTGLQFFMVSITLHALATYAARIVEKVPPEPPRISDFPESGGGPS